jgi:uncharacterized protein
MSELTQYVKAEVMRRLDRAEQSPAHRFDHMERVMRYARGIAMTIEGVDLEILELAVLLHDIEQPAGRKAEHVAMSLRVAEEILRRFGCPEDRAERVLQVISEHSSEHVRTVQPSSDEARVLFDADKLDGVGGIGVARVFSFFGQMDRPPLEAIGWYRGKIEIALAHIQTDEGRRLCEERLAYTQAFLARFDAETAADDAVWSV